MLTAKGLVWAYWLAVWWWISWIPLVGRLLDLINAGKPTVAQLLQQIKQAQTWEEYQETAHQLDERLGLISWFVGLRVTRPKSQAAKLQTRKAPRLLREKTATNLLTFQEGRIDRFFQSQGRQETCRGNAGSVGKEAVP